MGLLTYAKLCLFGLLLSSPFLGAEANSCPRDWMENQGNCYGYFEDEKTWAEAEIECQNYGPGTHLASIVSEPEAELVISYIMTHPHTKSVWIGLHDPRENGKWRWSDESAYNYKAWAVGQPDKHCSCEYCVELNLLTGLKYWNNNRCQKTNAYICKRKL